jgi:hypothetical protein
MINNFMSTRTCNNNYKSTKKITTMINNNFRNTRKCNNHNQKHTKKWQLWSRWKKWWPYSKHKKRWQSSQGTQKKMTTLIKTEKTITMIKNTREGDNHSQEHTKKRPQSRQIMQGPWSQTQEKVTSTIRSTKKKQWPWSRWIKQEPWSLAQEKVMQDCPTWDCATKDALH